jgi:hypothetical protein
MISFIRFITHRYRLHLTAHRLTQLNFTPNFIDSHKMNNRFDDIHIVIELLDGGRSFFLFIEVVFFIIHLF